MKISHQPEPKSERPTIASLDNDTWALFHRDPLPIDKPILPSPYGDRKDDIWELPDRPSDPYGTKRLYPPDPIDPLDTYWRTELGHYWSTPQGRVSSLLETAKGGIASFRRDRLGFLVPRPSTQLEQPTLLDRVADHKKGLAILTATTIGSLAAVAGLSVLKPDSKSSGQPHRSSRPSVTTVVDTIPNETVAHTEWEWTESEQAMIDELPKADQLGEVLSEPIPSTQVAQVSLGNLFGGGEIDIAEGYNSKFVGAYRSTQNIGINVYALAPEGDSTTLNEPLELHPETLQYLLNEIEKYIVDVPENPSKDAIIRNLAAAKSGTTEIVIELGLDINPQATCLDAANQLVHWLSSCVDSEGRQNYGVHGGVTEKDEEDGANGTIHTSTLVSSGAKYDLTGQNIVPDPALQIEMTGHETTHTLAAYLGNHSNNSHIEGEDDDHKTTGGMFGHQAPDQYDYPDEGAQLNNNIDFLERNRLLQPPITIANK